MAGQQRTSSAVPAPSPRALASFGLDPSWSRQVTFEGIEGPVTWHVLDSGTLEHQAATILCVHGNPTWSYIWRQFLETLPPTFRVIAVDQTNMGFSERQGHRRLADRIVELVRFASEEISGPIILAAHDWGGAIGVGSIPALDPVALILANTAVAKPDGVRVPPLIAAARGLVDLSCQRTPAFVEGTAQMTTKEHRSALRAPYKRASDRGGVRDFVADIPLDEHHRSATALAEVAAVAASVTVPTLLLWGGSDPVFHDRFRRDLQTRITHAAVERFDGVGHLVTLDAPVGDVVARWLDESLGVQPARNVATGVDPKSGSLLEHLERHRDDQRVIYRGPEGSLTWASLDERARLGASNLIGAGFAQGERVGLLIPPGPDLLVGACAIWMAGGIPVVADATGGISQLRRLIRASAPTWLVGTPSTLALARTARFAPGAKAAGFSSLPGVVNLGAPSNNAFEPRTTDATETAAIVHTSGATGMPKAVVYTHGALIAQLATLTTHFGLDTSRAFTTSFASFMLLAPLLEMACVRPDVPIDTPSAFGYDQLASVCAASQIATAWLSPAAARTIARTADGRQVNLPLVMLAGAPIPRALAATMRSVTAGEIRAPYGMTECLPITDGTEPLVLGALRGTSVGRPLTGATVVIVALEGPGGDAVTPEGWGEIAVCAPWMFDHYDHSFMANSTSSLVLDGVRYHRTGDVGYLEGDQLFVLGRTSHVLWTMHGPIASVAIEEPIGDALSCEVAAVGIGPAGAAVIVVVVNHSGALEIAPPALAASVRSASKVPLAAVLTGTLPVDHRHESKVDRIALGEAAAQLLAGR